MLKLNKVCKRFGNKTVADDICLTVGRGKNTCRAGSVGLWKINTAEYDCGDYPSGRWGNMAERGKHYLYAARKNAVFR